VADVLEVKDGSRRISFEGELIASVTSRSTVKPRWSEYRLYRTVNGQYLLEKVGVSVMVHLPGCPEIIDRLNRFQDEYPGRDPDEGFWYCDTCCRGHVDITALLVEHNRHWVTITEEPMQIVDALYRRKDGARHLPRLSLDLLDQAARVDDRIGDAFRVERL